MKNEAVEAATAAVASKSTYAGAGSMIVGWIFSNEFAVLIGMVVGVAGLLINWYYKTKADHRAAEADRRAAQVQAQADARERVEHELRVARLRRDEWPDVRQGTLE
ncbi:putative membrane protein [Variovorax boronicumulans]|uniref:holin n=1 Tax=Variovorax boronicumulans TaxID=436515 RepID=UPI0033981C4E